MRRSWRRPRPVWPRPLSSPAASTEAADVLDHLGERATDGGPPVAALARRMQGTVAAASGDTVEARALLQQAREIADKGGVEWESAFAALEIARLDDTTDDDRQLLSSQAAVVLARMGISGEQVMPPNIGLPDER